MADEALHFLLNKLKSEDGWSGSNLAWSEEKLSVISDQFTSFDGSAKVKVLLSFLGMTPRTITQCSKEMEHILRLARRDGDEWVRLFAGILAPFPHSQTINADVCLEDTMEGMVEEISDALRERSHQLFIPHEYSYLNAAVLEGRDGFVADSQNSHFVLKKRPHASQQLRSDVIQRASTDFSQTGSLVKDRHLLQRQMSASATVSTFVPTVRTPSSRKSVPIPGGSSRTQRERGTKLLGIDEVPMTNRRKRKLTTTDDTPSSSKAVDVRKHPRAPSKTEDTPTPLTAHAAAPPTPVATPDYAAGLGTVPEYAPASVQQGKLYGAETSGNPAGSFGKGVMLSPTLKTQNVDAARTLASLVVSTAGVGVSTTSTPPTSTPPPPSQPPPTPTSREPPPPSPLLPPATPTTPVAKQPPTKGLKLSKQQFLIAHSMFKESPSLTREQKALILGFMAGSRDNPNPSQSVVSIKLNERQAEEMVKGREGALPVKRSVLIETIFEMNYSNGQWRKLQLKRPLAAVAQ